MTSWWHHGDCSDVRVSINSSYTTCVRVYNFNLHLTFHHRPLRHRHESEHMMTSSNTSWHHCNNNNNNNDHNTHHLKSMYQLRPVWGRKHHSVAMAIGRHFGWQALKAANQSPDWAEEETGSTGTLVSDSLKERSAVRRVCVCVCFRREVGWTVCCILLQTILSSDAPMTAEWDLPTHNISNTHNIYITHTYTIYHTHTQHITHTEEKQHQVCFMLLNVSQFHRSCIQKCY